MKRIERKDNNKYKRMIKKTLMLYSCCKAIYYLTYFFNVTYNKNGGVHFSQKKQFRKRDKIRKIYYSNSQDLIKIY